VNRKVLNCPFYKEAKVVSIYVNTVGEIETDRLIKHALENGKAVFIPRFIKGCPEMQMLRLRNWEEFHILQPSLWGIRQFVEREDRTLYQDSGPIDLVLAPGVAFNRQGDRCGHGMGFYDKFFAEHRKLFGRMPRRVGLALRELLVEEVPMIETDVRLDEVMFSEGE